MAIQDTASEKELIKKIVEGDEKAFSVLFFRYVPLLNSFAIKFTKSTEAAQEIIQDSFVRVWLTRDRLAQVDNIKAYLYKYVSNECLSYLRKKLKEEKVIDNLKINYQQSSNSTSDSVDLNEMRRMVESAVDKLPNQRRKIYQLSRNEGKNIPEIAELLGISANTVKNSLVSALKFVREELYRNGITFSLTIFLVLFGKK